MPKDPTDIPDARSLSLTIDRIPIMVASWFRQQARRGLWL